ncbi:hypothetical protein F4778DRAFT_781018 [Xylariomycetidae sp. FL2044]|nr:hypothetical protein F4778DRAFT_781018 [Xylariomycetidae sp. FL2044]
MLANGHFLYSQTAPTDLSGSVWDTATESTQNFHGDEDFQFSYGQITPRGEDQAESVDAMTSKWIATEPAAGSSGEPMQRVSSRGSSGSHRNNTVKAAPHKSRPRIVSPVSQGSHMSNFDMTGNAHMDCYLLPDSDATSVSSQMFYPTLPISVGLTADGLPYPSNVLVPGMAQQHIDPTQMHFDASMSGTSPISSWGGSFSPESRNSSPGVPDDVPDDAWSVPLNTSATHSNTSSPVMDGLPPSLDRQMSMMTSEDANGLVLADDMFALPPSFTRRASDGESAARDHPLYKNAFPKADGLFHCPWEGESNCNHKPEKLKCNYDKFVDSHLKPYRCKDKSCENARFSSTACLLRHEREAHAMHGHGDKPYLCTYDGCDRAVIGNGFPRQWNLKDHMRRVHNDNGSSLIAANESPSAAHGSAHSTKGRKRKNKDSVDGSSSSRKHAARSAQAAEAAAAAARAAEQPLIDEWHQHHQALHSYLQEYNMPDAFDCLNHLAEAKDHLAALGKISERLMMNKKGTQARDSYRRSYTG